MDILDTLPVLPGIVPTINLFSQAPEAFFHDEDSPSERIASPAATVKLQSDLSLNAPSFTPMSEERREKSLGFLDALRTHISANSSSDPPPISPDHHSAPSIPLSWTYLDPKGVPQGPFTGEQMAGWFAAGYFPKDLPVSWEGNGKQFHSLDQVYPTEVSPFLSTPTLPLKRTDFSARTAASQVPVSPPRSRGWLWSPEEDVKLEEAAVASLTEIMSTEAARKSFK